GFFSRIGRHRPWVRVKLAMSLDGRTALASGESKWITGEAARADVQRWRARSSAILTGLGTVRADNPRLTVRLPNSPEDGAADNGPLAPLRVVLDSRLRLPADAHVLDGSAPTLLMHARDCAPGDRDFGLAERVGVEMADDRLDLKAVLGELARRQVNELQVEAGPILCGSLLAEGLVDELLLYIAPVLLGDRANPLLALPLLSDMAARWKLKTIDQRMLGPDSRWLLHPEEN
ncbi:MAG: bifunctional diaminohydroxyphosphoribosylaminopyrimidine deaminase/5-amino-6-(5-phosphoribosylamino)uracil reductase RibD, partial [Xanthomonadales bacterium]|nr:bifunctional diaminohydroxyphosphoribosylaminopyrimidine deaminase/5-amino-6-(5-phosphoribosylamino)uracil reductase RibD [Xanthomonadales bacterium]